MSVNARLKNVFGETFDMSPEDIGEDTSPKTLLAWDSIKGMVLALSVEEEFGVQFTDTELVDMDSFAQIEKTLAAKGIS